MLIREKTMFWINLHDTGTLEDIKDFEIRRETMHQPWTLNEVYAIKHGGKNILLQETIVGFPKSWIL